MLIKKFQILSFLILLIILSSATWAQFKSQVKQQPTLEQAIKIPSSNSQTGLNLFDPQKFHMNQSYSFSMGFGGNGNQSMGMYLNNMSYMLSNNLMVNAKLGFIHNPLQMGSPGIQSDISSNLIYGAEVLYKPTENFNLRISYNKMPYYRSQYLYPYNSYSY